MKLEVGQKLWIIVPEYRNQAPPNDPKETVITKIGRKYFEVDAARDVRFDIETLRDTRDANYKYLLYLTLQEILDEREQAQLQDKIGKAFSWMSIKRHSLDQLRRINQIIEEPNI